MTSFLISAKNDAKNILMYCKGEKIYDTEIIKLIENLSINRDHYILNELVPIKCVIELNLLNYTKTLIFSDTDDKYIITQYIYNKDNEIIKKMDKYLLKQTELKNKI